TMVMTLGVGGRAFTEVSQVDSRNLHRTRIASRDTAPQREVLSRAARDLTPCPGSRAFVFRDPGAPSGASGRGFCAPSAAFGEAGRPYGAGASTARRSSCT